MSNGSQCIERPWHNMTSGSDEMNSHIACTTFSFTSNLPYLTWISRIQGNRDYFSISRGRLIHNETPINNDLFNAAWNLWLITVSKPQQTHSLNQNGSNTADSNTCSSRCLPSRHLCATFSSLSRLHTLFGCVRGPYIPKGTSLLCS